MFVDVLGRKPLDAASAKEPAATLQGSENFPRFEVNVRSGSKQTLADSFVSSELESEADKEQWRRSSTINTGEVEIGQLVLGTQELRAKLDVRDVDGALAAAEESLAIARNLSEVARTPHAWASSRLSEI